MANKNPKTQHLKPHQWKTIGESPLSAQVIGTRYPEEIHAVLMAMPPSDRQQFIRSAVNRSLQGEVQSGNGINPDELQSHINAVLLTIPPRQRAEAAKLFKKLTDRLNQP